MIANLARGAVVLLMVWQLVSTRSYAQNGASPDSSSATATQSQDRGPEGIRDNQLRKIGGAVSAPRVIHNVFPEFSEEARKDKFSGVVLVGLIVDTDGMPQQVHVLRGVGHGLDEKAIEAISHYRFQPAMENGKPVPVRVNVEVNFQIRDRK
jgi:TonB family protein